MFTGLIETTGTIIDARRHDRALRIGILPAADPFDLAIGGSLAVDGVCLTVERIDRRTIWCAAVAETLSRTTLVDARPNREVNLERALRTDQRLDGHFVLGHVDGVGMVRADRTAGASIERSIAAPSGLRRFLVEKGSVAIDGISLTIARVDADTITAALIPHTVAHTVMQRKKPGDAVNIECDILARYILAGRASVIDGASRSAGVEDDSREETLQRALERLG